MEELLLLPLYVKHTIYPMQIEKNPRILVQFGLYGLIVLQCVMAEKTHQ
jgi:hypothetical protein